MPDTILGKRNVIHLHPNAGTWEKSPGTAADEASSSTPATNLHSPNTYEVWRNTSTDTDDCTLSKDKGGRYTVAALQLSNTNISDSGSVQYIEDAHWGIRNTLDLSGQSLTSSSDIEPTDSYTFEITARLRSWSTKVDKVLCYLGTTNLPSTRDWRLKHTGGGDIHFVQDRHSSQNDELTDTSPWLHMGRFYHIAVSFDNSTGDFKLYIDHVLVDSAVLNPIPTPPTATTDKFVINLGNEDWEILDARYWGDVITPSDYKNVILDGNENDLVFAYQFTDNSDTTPPITIASVTGNHGATATGGVWRTTLNRWGLYDSLPVAFNGCWAQRRTIFYNGVDDFSSTDASVTIPISYSIQIWLKLPKNVPAQSRYLFIMGSDADLATTCDSRLRTNGSVVSFQVARYSGSFTSLTWSAVTNDDVWHHYLCIVDGVQDRMYLYVDGSPHASNGTACAAFSSQTGEKIGLAGSPDGSKPSRLRVVGDVIVHNRVIALSEMTPYTRPAVAHDLSIVGMWALEEGTSDEEILMENQGSAGSAWNFTTAASSGTPDHSDLINAPDELPAITGVDSPVWLPGDVDDISRLTSYVDRLSSSVFARYSTIVVYDPLNTDGYIEIGGTYVSENHSFNDASNASNGAVTSNYRVRGIGEMEVVTPDVTFTPANVTLKELGTTYRVMRVLFRYLSIEQRVSIEHYLTTSSELRGPILLSLADDESRYYWKQRSIVGVPEKIEVTQEWLVKDKWSIEVVVRELGV